MPITQKKEKLPASTSGLADDRPDPSSHRVWRQREFCLLCEKEIDYGEAESWFNIDVSQGNCSWGPCCEFVLCRSCVEKRKKACAKLILDRLGS